MAIVVSRLFTCTTMATVTTAPLPDVVFDTAQHYIARGTASAVPEGKLRDPLTGEVFERDVNSVDEYVARKTRYGILLKRVNGVTYAHWANYYHHLCNQSDAQAVDDRVSYLLALVQAILLSTGINKKHMQIAKRHGRTPGLAGVQPEIALNISLVTIWHKLNEIEVLGRAAAGKTVDVENKGSKVGKKRAASELEEGEISTSPAPKRRKKVTAKAAESDSSSLVDPSELQVPVALDPMNTEEDGGCVAVAKKTRHKKKKGSRDNISMEEITGSAELLEMATEALKRVAQKDEVQ
jgi:hypothetical protein